MTTNRACGTSHRAVRLGAAVILAGLRDWLVLGGVRWADLLDQVFASRPEVLAHELETVLRFLRRMRPASTYDEAPKVLTRARTADLITRTNPILGLGETTDEVVDDLADLHSAGCDLPTITQYLRPSPNHHPLERWVHHSELEQDARDPGFAGVRTGPTVRACHRTGRLYAAVMASNRRSHHAAGS
jgi:lipoyl synthase